jgi:hypothetical protein
VVSFYDRVFVVFSVFVGSIIYFCFEKLQNNWDNLSCKNTEGQPHWTGKKGWCLIANKVNKVGFNVCMFSY